MFQRILVGLDGSPASEQTLPWVQGLAEVSGAQVRLVRAQVLPQAGFPQDFPFTPDAYEYERERCQDYLREVAGSIAPHSTAETAFLPGPGPAEAILRDASDWSSDLIVLGASGHGRFERWLLGSVAQTVLRAAHCPVLLVKGQSLWPPQRILVPLDGSDFAAQALSLAVPVARAAGSEVRLVTVFPAPVAAERPQLGHLLKACAELAVERCDYQALFGEADEKILDEAAHWQCRLIVLASHGRRGRQRFWLGSVAERVARHAACSVLVWKAGAAR